MKAKNWITEKKIKLSKSHGEEILPVDYACNLMDLFASEKTHELLKMLEKINVIMWESYMIKDRPFGRDEGRKIMEVLEQWAERH